MKQKIQPLKSEQNYIFQQTRTKQKFEPLKHRENQKPTVSIKNRSYNQLASKLISQSAVISEQSSHHGTQQQDNKVIQIDQLCINGNITNLRQVNQYIKVKYSLNNGVMFDLQNQYLVIFAGRNQIGLRNGLNVCLYAPSRFKSARNPQSNKIQVLIQRKIHPDIVDPRQFSFLILSPHISLYPTYICSWLQCKRKITLQHYIEYPQQSAQPLAIGNSIHRYLQWLIRKMVPVWEPTQVQLRKLYQSFIYQMYIIGYTYQKFVQKVQKGIVNLVKWYDQFVINKNQIILNKWEKKYLKIQKILGSEVMVKSKYFGIRGKVDGLFQGIYTDQKNNKKYEVVIPFQLKTGGKVMDSHKKQVDFYNLLLRQSRNMPTLGLLYYSQSSTLDFRMQNPLTSWQNINIHRNKIVLNIINLYQQNTKINLPSLPETFDQCRFCDVQIECAVTRLESNQIGDIEDLMQGPQRNNIQVRDKIKSLSVLQFSYLKKWIQYLHLQECAQRQQNYSNAKKHYFSNLKLSFQQIKHLVDYEPSSVSQTQPSEQSRQNSLKFTLCTKIYNQQMSEQLQLFYKASEKLRIFIPLIKMTDCCRILSTWKNTKYFYIKVQIKNENVKYDKNKCIFLIQQAQYLKIYDGIQVDLQKFQNSSYSYARGYCFKFVSQAKKWLKNIVIEQSYELSAKKIKILDQPKQLQGLNVDQAQAFKNCIQMEHFRLVQGMPGTGKTQLILKLISYFYRTGRRVLVTSYTNQALTNILSRQLQNQKSIPHQHILRQGSRYAISQQYQSFSSQSQQFVSIQNYKQFFNNKKVWFVTISSLYLQHLPQKFDVVIVDEASQCLEANCLQALMRADKFILIGDERQLQPVVKSKIAIQKGMQISLFQRLCKLYPNMKTTLKKQYRMSPAIMNLTNKLVYNGSLQLAVKSLQTRTLALPMDWQSKVPKYLHQIITPSKSVRFLSIDSAINLFSQKDNIDMRKIKRMLLLRITSMLYKYFRIIGIKKQEILIISAYNSLVHQITQALNKQKLIEGSGSSEVLTIDKSQGTDKQVIIFIFHKGNKQLIENFRRLNVALTRAKNKFIIVGSQKQLSELALWTGQLAILLKPDQINVQRQLLESILNNS